jgi:adenine phosphoribosyltransferase
MSIEKISAAIRDIPDFPKPGIIFKDITPVLSDAELLVEIVDHFAEHYSDKRPDYVAGIESRGFIFGTALAIKLGCGFIPIRKKGKLPYKTFESSYELEYGTATIEIHADALKKGDKIVIVDDLLATGGTVGAAIELVEKFDVEILGVEFLLELAFLEGRKKLTVNPVNSLIVVD